MNIEIIRDTKCADGILGTITIGSLTLQTLELPWVPLPEATCGKPDVSCVPAGEYSLALHNTREHPRTFALVAPGLGVYHEPADVPAECVVSRVGCLIHMANWPSELEGCIALGKSRGPTPGPAEIWDSVIALQAFLTLVPWVTGHTLTIAYADGVTP